MSAFEFEPKFSAGTLRTVPGTERRVTVSDFGRWVRESWPDLPEGAEIAMLPNEDLAVIVEATRGRHILPIRQIKTFNIRRNASGPERTSFLGRLLADPVFTYLLGLFIATAIFWGAR